MDTHQKTAVVPRRFKLGRNLVIIIAAVIVILLGAIIWWQFFSGQQRIMHDRYQAVHLQDGRVFFGKLQNTNGEFMTLLNPYYTDLKNSGDQAPKQLSLIKVGDEVYGPERSVSVARSTVQYWENLRTDSKVIEAIKQRQ